MNGPYIYYLSIHSLSIVPMYVWPGIVSAGEGGGSGGEEYLIKCSGYKIFLSVTSPCEHPLGSPLVTPLEKCVCVFVGRMGRISAGWG